MSIRLVNSILSTLLVASSSGVLAEFIVDDQIVSDPTISIVDPEFDPIGNRMVWQDLNGNLWLADVDPVSGDINPSTGQGTLIDTGLALIQDTLNGPEWAYGGGTTNIVYTKRVGDLYQLGYAQDDTIGGWMLTVPRRGYHRWRPFGTPASNFSQAPRIAYLSAAQTPQKSLAWRNLNNWLSEGVFEESTVLGGRWVEHFDAFITTFITNSVRQVALIETATGTVYQLTNDPVPKFLPYMWFAPELGELVFMTMIDKTSIGIYRKISGQWTNVYSFEIPSTKQFVHSPEPFVSQGKSYIVTVAADELGSPGNWLAQPQGPTEIWIAGIDQANPFFRRVDDPAEEHNRLDPETFETTNGPVVYYTEKNLILNKFLLRRAATGL